MAPLVEAFPPSQLSKRVQTTTKDRTQKPPVILKDCELKEMMQYFCDLDGPKEDKKSKVVCEPVLRMFRQVNADVEIKDARMA
ncbi:hypothetical protein LTR09_007337 [Extremus antarcticus]|uniref:Uncharacterized protein n=1 Tax=Extremus antarcticus TaxID=702011 RepID=A0AAJ0G802_9PEZI|nr:hypothetical protein LTR09_007337 [Extremus antarcticus]